MNRAQIDSRGWNVSTERRFKPEDLDGLKPLETPRPSNLELHFRLVMLGFIVAGVIGLLSGAPIDGIG